MSLLSKLEASLTEKGALIADRDRAKVDLGAALAANTELSGKLAASEANTSALQAKVSDLESKLAEASKQLSESTDKASADLLAANQAKDAAEANVKKLIENPSAVALEIAAKAGVKPADLPKASSKVQGAVLSKAEFDALKPYEKSAFFRDGGRLS